MIPNQQSDLYYHPQPLLPQVPIKALIGINGMVDQQFNISTGISTGSTQTEPDPLQVCLYEIQTILNRDQSLESLLSQCVTALEQTLGVSALHLWTFNQRTQLLELKAQSESVRLHPLFAEQIPLGISIIGLTAQNHTPYVTDQLGQSLCVIPIDHQARHTFKTFAVYPLLAANQLMGALAFFSRHPLSPETRHTLGWLMPALGYAIAYHQSQASLHSRQDTVLHRLSSQMQNTLDLDKILSVAVQEIRDIFQIDRCNFIWCWSHEETDDCSAQLLPMMAITHEAKRSHLPSLLGDCSASQIKTLAPKILTLEGIEVVHIDQIETGSEEPLAPSIDQMLTEWNLQASLLYPLETHLGQLGAILCGQVQGPRVWTQAERDLLGAIAGQLSSAINQAELYAQTKAAAFAAQSQAHQLTEALEHLKQAQAKLIQSEKMSSLGQLVAGIAHEINNPVGFIGGNLNYAQTYFGELLTLIHAYQAHYPCPHPDIQALIDDIDLDFLVDDLDKLLNSMQIGSDRIRQIVLSLRNFSRLDEADLKHVNIHEGIDNTLLILQNRLRSKDSKPNIKVIKQYGELPLVNCYAGPLNQVFMNLLSNAIDALDDVPQGGTIRITTTDSTILNADGDEVDAVRISIADNGPGIPQENLSHLFDPFFTTKEIGKGTGLGLAISYQIIVERHHGSLTCMSELGHGAEFIIDIPAIAP